MSPEPTETMPGRLVALDVRANDTGYAVPGEPESIVVPRREHPRPQLWRPDWMCLNGEWDFEIDQGDSGLERGLVTADFSRRILVPFAPESHESGIETTDFLQAVWYRRTVRFPEAWRDKSLLLHFGAVDYDTTVWIDCEEAGRHRGGFSSFSIPVPASSTEAGAMSIVVRARDLKDSIQARGKQSTWFASSHANYTRTTGIWQSVWLEAVPEDHIDRVSITPTLASGTFDVLFDLSSHRHVSTVRATLFAGSVEIATADLSTGLDLAPSVRLVIPEEHVRVWRPGDPFLYDLLLELLDSEDNIVDTAQSYAGLRSVAIDGDRLSISGKLVFQRLVLDQGYWPDTLMTAPDDAALENDILLGLTAGFNGARLHQKAFEERYFYHADRLGYLIWGEFGDWGVSGQGALGANQAPASAFVAEWLEILRRDVNHPSIIGWCPLNETHQVLHDRTTVLDDVTLAMFLATKLADPTRPVIDASGYSHRVPVTDVYDSHSYEQIPVRFAKEQRGLAEGRPFLNRAPDGEFSIPYRGQPYFVSEFGGIWWDADQAADGSDRLASWGYGERVRNIEEFYERFDGLVSVLVSDAGMFGYCYTQLTDVLQEQNGIYGFDRSEKFDMARIRQSLTRPAAYDSRA